VPRRPLMQQEVTEVAVPQDQTAEMYQSVSDTVSDFATIQRKKDLANIKTYMSQANADMLEFTNQWRTSNNEDPTNQDALGKLQAGYDKILTQYGQKVGMFGKGDWLQVGERLKAQYRSDNINWGERQTVINAENGINGGIEKDMQIYRQLGQTFDYDKLKGSYMLSREVLAKFGSQTIGKAKTDKLLQDYQSDSLSIFIYGATEKDPDKAEMLLNQEKVRADIGDPGKIDTLRRYIARQRELKKQGVELAMNEAEDKLTDSYLQDKLDIMGVDRALNAKQIRPEFAKQMREALLSDKAPGAMTDDKEFVKAVDMMFTPKKKLEDINNYLLAKRAEGKLSDDDALVIKTFASNIGRKGYTKFKIGWELMPEKVHKNIWEKLTWYWREHEGNENQAIVSMWKEYTGLVGQGKSPQDALNDVIARRKIIAGYKIGDLKTFFGRPFKCTGFYDDGEPNFEPVR